MWGLTYSGRPMSLTLPTLIRHGAFEPMTGEAYTYLETQFISS